MFNQLVNEFNDQLKCLGENTEKYITFSISIKKEFDNNKTITYKLKLIDSFRFMSTSLSILSEKLSEIYKKECKGCEEKTKIKSVRNIIGPENDKLNYECKKYKKKMVNAYKRIYKLIRIYGQLGKI